MILVAGERGVFSPSERHGILSGKMDSGSQKTAARSQNCQETHAVGSRKEYWVSTAAGSEE